MRNNERNVNQVMPIPNGRLTRLPSLMARPADAVAREVQGGVLSRPCGRGFALTERIGVSGTPLDYDPDPGVPR